MSDIHPTAIIKEGAIIGADCKIGPNCIIGPNVILENVKDFPMKIFEL